MNSINASDFKHGFTQMEHVWTKCPIRFSRLNLTIAKSRGFHVLDHLFSYDKIYTGVFRYGVRLNVLGRGLAFYYERIHDVMFTEGDGL